MFEDTILTLFTIVPTCAVEISNVTVLFIWTALLSIVLYDL